MPNRPNPFYRYTNPALGMGFNGLAAAMFPDQSMDAVRQAAAVENMAQARQADAMAGFNNERARGQRNENDAMVADPRIIGQFIANGGTFQDDPLMRNRSYNPQIAPTDFASILTTEPAIAQPSASPFMPQNTAADKFASMIQEAAIRKIPLDKLMEAAGVAEYLRRIGGPNPDSALAAAPFAGVRSPNADTALTTTRQDQISARNSAEDIAKQETVNKTNLSREEMQQTGSNQRNDATNRTNLTREGMQQSGADRRNKYSVDNRSVSAGNNTDTIVPPAQGRLLGIEPDEQGRYIVRGRATVGTGQDQQPGSLGGDAVAGRERQTKSGGSGKDPAVPKAATDRMEKKIKAALQADGVTADENVITGLMSAAGESWKVSKNPDAAADDIIQRLRAGETVNGVTSKTGRRTIAGVEIPNTERKSISRSAPAAADDPIARARDAIARGAPRDAVIKRLKDNGIDPKGL